MKNLFLICLCVLSSYWLNGQSTTQKRPISIAYFGQYGIEPGLKISTEFNLKKLAAETQKTKQLYISPQVGFFVRPHNNSNLFLNADIGIKKRKDGKSSFAAFALGLGYLHQFQISAVSVQLGDGNQSISSTNNAYFLPSINYVFGNKIGRNMGWYSKIGAGQRFGGRVSSSLTVLIELGLQFQLF